MANLQDLVASFHSLEGNFISEKRKNLNALLNLVEASLTSEEELSAFITALSPRNRQEEVFRVVALIRFRRNGELLKILKSGKPLLIRKLLKDWQFFRDTFGNVDARVIVNEVLPHTSFSTRVKVINRLSKNLISEQQADDYFKAIEHRYGLKTASIILPGCSSELIQSVLTQYKIKLRERQLLLILKKHPKFVEFYCDHLESTGHFVQFNHQILEYIAKTNPELFWEHLNVYTVNVRFGKHLTWRMLQDKSDIDVRFRKYMDTFKITQMLKILAKDKKLLRDFCLNQLPNDIHYFHSDRFTEVPLRQCFRRVKDSKRYDVFSFYFREKYEQDLQNFPQKISFDLLKIMPVDKRELVLEEKVKVDEDLIYMCNTRKSIPVIKERINTTSDITTRDKLVRYLLKTCEFHKNDGALLYVLRYMSKRHKNDLVILQNFILRLREWKYLENLSAEHWDIINDFLRMLEISVTNFSADIIYLEKYLLFRAKNHLPYDEQLRNLLKRLEKEFYRLQSFDNQKFFLEKFGPLIPELFQDKDYENMSIAFLDAVINYNKTKKAEEIPLTNFPQMLTLSKSLVTKRFDAVNVISYCIQTYDGYDSFFWENLSIFHSDDIIEWYLKSKPLQVIQNIEVLLKWCSMRIHMQLIKKIAFTNKTVQFYLDTLLDKKCNYRDVAIPALSLLLKHEEYFEAVKDLYPPPDGKIDILNSSYAELSFQKQVVENLKNLSEPTQCLPILLKYCIADYLKYALAPLYCLVIHTPEIDLPPFLETLYKAAVSVRKHVAFLTSIVSTKEVIYKFLKVAGQTDKNPSLQKAVLRKTLAYFIENPSEALWNLFQENINIIDKNDREAHSDLLDLTRIPDENLPQYIKLVYEKFDSNSDEEIRDNKYELVSKIPKNTIDKLDETFLKHLVDITLLLPKVTYFLADFYITCIFYTKGQKQANLYQYIFNIWKKFIKESWSGPVKGQARKQVYDFVNQFCTNCLNVKAEKSFLEKFANDWKTLLQPEEVIEEYLIVDFTVLYFNSNSEREFGSKLNEHLHHLVQKYDMGIVQIFAGVMEVYLSNILSLQYYEDKYLAFVEGFFYKNQSTQTYLVLLETLCKKALSDKSFGAKYQPMYELVRQCEVPIIQVRLKRYLRQECLDELN